MKTLITIFFLSKITLLLTSCAGAQVPANTSDTERRPRLIVGITVDQMRYDYIERYWNDYSQRGFKRLINDGFICRNLQYNYMPTYTGPGHASIFTGTTPAYHSIIQNDWFERSSGKMMYCSSDSMVSGVGTASLAGKMSPNNLKSETMGDAMELFFNDRSKIIGISMKDRGAILPAGRTADAAYWFVGAGEGVWATSTWYMNDLPPWVKTFNTSGKAEDYMNQTWDLLKDASVYDESNADNNAHEAPFKGLLKPVFPYDLKALRNANGNFDLIKATPYGNNLTADFARATIENENMGMDEFTDMLCMSFSATDYIGHQFGIHAMETQDCYLRLDELVGNFMEYLDKTVGNDNYLIFLTADHGGAPTPSYTLKSKASSGYWKSDSLEIFVENALVKKHGPGNWILNESNQNIFLNRELISEKKMNLEALQDEVVDLTIQFPEVHMSFPAYDLSKFDCGIVTKEMVRNGFSQSLSGDVIYTLKPSFIEYGKMGTTHGSPYVYDSHVPAIFYGFGVQSGETYEPYSITDIAPTVAFISRLPLPDACTGKPIIHAIKKKK
jgi:predicted AlkP superfamily pyrophosphatase or phosphodiesterase